jgi:putative ABC transport system ATP-binding protein
MKNDNATTVIEMEKVNLWYNKEKETEVHALKDISLSIKQGEYVAFFGPSGCGKTSVLYALSGIDRYQSGSVKIHDADLTQRSNEELSICRQTDIGIVFQQFNLIASLTVLQNVTLPMMFLGKTLKEANEEGLRLLARLDLTSYTDRFPFELSGGQQQRVGIARALANNPPIIIADEPLGNLDSVSATNVLAFLKELNEKDGRTIIMVTHEAWSLKDVEKVFYMKDGAVVETEDQTEETIAESLSKKLYRQLSKTDNEGKEKSIPATVLSHFLMRGYSPEEIERFETFLQERMAGRIDSDQFRIEIDKPFKNGGVGFWKQKAKRVSAYIEEVINERHDVDSLFVMIEKSPELSIQDEVQKIEEWLCKEYTGKLSNQQRIQLLESITKRIKGISTAEQFRGALRESKRKGGVGLSLRASQVVGERMELLLVEEGHDEGLTTKGANETSK